MFHARDDITFERLTFERQGGPKTDEEIALFGGVRISRLPNRGGDPGFDVSFSPSEWASIVASMTALGENTHTHAMIYALQR